MIEAYLSACGCVFARSLLSVFDRTMMQNKKNDFLLSVFFNSLFPFILAILTAISFGREYGYTFGLLSNPGVILSALGAHMTAYSFFLAFREMSVKTVAISSKLADLFIPLTTFLLTMQINWRDYLFSNMTVLLFLPILAMIIKTKEQFHARYIQYILYSLVFQSVINIYFEMHQYATSWADFFSLMAVILFWRSIYISIPVIKKIITRQSEEAKGEVLVTQLFIRSVLAFIAQAAFFYSITRQGSAIAWPVLNATPLASCFMAHALIGERIGRLELAIFLLFIALSFGYLLYYARFS